VQMSDPATRARLHFPTIQITMVSIIVAFALQEWLDRLPTIDSMWEPSLLAARIWCQALVGFVIIVKMWSGFVLTSVVSERVPTAVDLLGPIGILIFVDAQIASIGETHVLRWWYVLAAGSLVAAAFIAVQTRFASGKRSTFVARFAPSSSRLGNWLGPRLPATAEAVLGIIALLVAALHHAMHLSETSLLVASAVYLAIQGLSAVGPMLTWRMLRNAQKQ
jgi:hypothetical protein